MYVCEQVAVLLTYWTISKGLACSVC